MGAYYYYINESKRQYFSIDPFLNNEIKSFFVGLGLGSRGLSFLLWGDNFYDSPVTQNLHSLVGSWVGDRVTVASDHHYGKFDELESDFTDVANEVVEMLIAIEPFVVRLELGNKWMLSLINGELENLAFTDKMRNSLLDAFTQENTNHPNEELRLLLNAIRAV